MYKHLIDSQLRHNESLRQLVQLSVQMLSLVKRFLLLLLSLHRISVRHVPEGFSVFSIGLFRLATISKRIEVLPPEWTTKVRMKVSGEKHVLQSSQDCQMFICSVDIAQQVPNSSISTHLEK